MVVRRRAQGRWLRRFVRRYRNKARGAAKARRAKLGQIAAYGGKGGMMVLRRTAEQTITNTNVQGVALTGPAATSMLTIGTPVVTTGNCYDIPFSLQFRLDQILGLSDFTNLFESYKIKKVYIRAWFNHTESGTGSVYQMPHLYYSIDNDDALPPSSMNQFRERMDIKFKCLNNNRPTKITLTPKYQLQAQEAAAGVSFIQGRGGWIDTTDVDVMHYGLKGIVANFPLPVNTGGINERLKFDVAFLLDFKGVN